MKNRRFFYFFTILFYITPCNPVVILVHGSLAAQETWYRPDGDFYQILEQEALLLGHMLVAFSWSGNPTSSEIKLSGKALARLICSYSAQEEIILIGHIVGIQQK